MKITLFVVLLFNGACLTLRSKTSESQSGSSFHFLFSPLPHLMDHDINCETNLKPPESRGLKRAAQVKFVMPLFFFPTSLSLNNGENKTRQKKISCFPSCCRVWLMTLQPLMPVISISSTLADGRKRCACGRWDSRGSRKNKDPHLAKKRGNTRHLNGQMDLSRNLETIQSAERILKKKGWLALIEPGQRPTSWTLTFHPLFYFSIVLSRSTRRGVSFRDGSHWNNEIKSELKQK